MNKEGAPVVYTEEYVKEQLKILLEEATWESYLTMSKMFENKEYSQQRFSEWAEKYSNNYEISESIKKIKEIFQNKINEGALRGKLNATMAIFNLKNNYGWKDKTEQDLNVKSVSLTELFNESNESK